MTIQAKFRCTSVKKNEYNQEVVEFTAASGPGNASWSEATPSGKIEMSITNQGAHGVFIPKKHYLLKFEDISE
jgi:hypothetical protein